MSAPGDRHLSLVVGVGRSGTSLLTGILGQLGFLVPQPEVAADDTNPKGFSEPRWVVDFHTRLLRSQRVTVNDSRPAGFELTRRAGEAPEAHSDLRRWLEGQFAEAPSVVVKDPRTSWFLPLWEAVAHELQTPTSFVTMLRHPTEVIASARASYGDWQSEASRAAAWVNVTLETELATRGARRAFVRHEDLLADWRGQLTRVETALGLPLLSRATPEQVAGVEAFVDPGLHRNRGRWEDRDVPAPVRDLAERVWEAVQPLATPDGETPELRAALDELRAEYALLYAEAEAIAHSSIVAVKPRPPKPNPPERAKPAPAPPASLRVRLARRVPKRYRRRIRRAAAALGGRR